MMFLENKQMKTNDDGKSFFDGFFRSENMKMDLSYQDMINIMKSNVCLMLYNGQISQVELEAFLRDQQICQILIVEFLFAEIAFDCV